MSNVKPTYVSPTDGTPKPVNTATDSIAANAVYVQTSATPDTNVGISRDGSNNLVLTDTVTGSKTLAQLAASGGPDAGQREPALARYDFAGTPGPTLPTAPAAPVFAGTVRYVGSGGMDYANVGDAVGDAVAGDIIEVRAGYTSVEVGTVTINKSLEIRGQNRATSIITGPTALTNALLRVAAGVNNVYIHTCTVWNKQLPATDGGGISSCITAPGMTETYPLGSTGLYFSDLNLWYPKMGISIQGAGFVIDNCTFSCNTNLSTTTIAAGSDGAGLPQATINVADTSTFPNAGTLLVVSTTGFHSVPYTGKTPTTFTGCSGGTGFLYTGGFVALQAATTVRSIVNYGQTGDCFVTNSAFYNTADVTTPRMVVCYVTANNPGAGTFVPGHQGNFVFQNVTESGTCNAYYLQDVFHQPDTRNGSNYQNAPTPGSLGLWFDGCSFNGQWSGNSISFTDSVTTTVAAGSNGQTLPQATINVASAASFPATGSFRIRTTAGVETITYTGKTGTTFTGCTGGTGTMATGNGVWNLDTLNYFSTLYANNCTGQSRTTGDNKGFIAVAGSGGVTRQIGAPTTGLYVLGTNTFNSTLPSATYAAGSTVSNFLGVVTANFATPSPLLSPTVPIYIPSGALTADDVALNVGDRVMLVQTDDPTYSGLYEVQAGEWTRVTDMADGAAASGYYWWVLAGTEYANTQYVVANVPGVDTVGTDALTFRRILVNDDDTTNFTVTAYSASLTANVDGLYLEAAGGSGVDVVSSNAVNVTAAAGGVNVTADTGNVNIGATAGNVGVGCGGNFAVNATGSAAISGGTEAVLFSTLAPPLTGTVTVGSSGSVNANATTAGYASSGSTYITAGEDVDVRADGALHLGRTATPIVYVGNPNPAITTLVEVAGDNITLTTATGVNVNGEYTLPVADGAAGDVLTTDGAGVVTWASAGGGLTYWTESESNTGVNSSIPVDTFTAASTGDHVDAALAAKGRGATLAQIPNGATSGGDKRGWYVTDLQKKRNDNTQVASADYATLLGGEANKIEGLPGAGYQSHGAIVGGYGNSISPQGTGANSPYGFIGGGYGNTVGGGSYGVIGGGLNNVSRSPGAGNVCGAVVGGQQNSATGGYSFIGAGYINAASKDSAAVVGGRNNTASGQWSTVLGGRGNEAKAQGQLAGGEYAYTFSDADPDDPISTDPLLTLGNGTGTGASSSNALTLLKDGSLALGLGQSKPSERLHVAGNVRFSGALMPNNAAGTAGQVLTSAGTGAPPTWTTISSGSVPVKVGLAFNASTTSAVLTVVGGGLLAANDYTGKTIKFEIVGFVAGAGDTLDVELYDVTNLSTVTSITTTSTTSAGGTSVALTLSATSAVYEVQIKNLTGTGNVTLLSANFVIS